MTSALFAAIGEMHSWRRVWEWQELYFTSGFKIGKVFQMFPQTIQKLKAVTQPQIKCVYTANVIDALRNVFCTKFVRSLEVIFQPTGAKGRKHITLCRCMSFPGRKFSIFAKISIRISDNKWQFWDNVSTVMNLRVPWNAGNFLTSCKPVSFSRRTLHHGVS